MIIGLIHNKTKTHTLVSQYITSEYNFTNYSMRHRCNQIAITFGFDMEDPYYMHPIFNVTTRTFLQRIEKYMDRILAKIIPEMNTSETIWIQFLKKFLQRQEHSSILICDIYFEEEALTLLEYPDTFLIYVEEEEHTMNKFEPCITIDLHNIYVTIDTIMDEFNLINETFLSILHHTYLYIQQHWKPEHYCTEKKEWDNICSHQVEIGGINCNKCNTKWDSEIYIVERELISIDKIESIYYSYCPVCDKIMRPYLSNPRNKYFVSKYIDETYHDILFE